MNDRELMQMALNALEECYDVQAYPANGETIQDDAIKELCARLAQPESDPVAYINIEKRMLEWAKPTRWETPTVVKMDKVPLYTAPPQREWVGLTDDEIDDIWAKFNDGYGIIEETLWGYEQAIETKLREKNDF